MRTYRAYSVLKSTNAFCAARNCFTIRLLFGRREEAILFAARTAKAIYRDPSNPFIISSAATALYL